MGPTQGRNILHFAWVPHTFGGVWPLLTFPYFTHWLLSLTGHRFQGRL